MEAEQGTLLAVIAALSTAMGVVLTKIVESVNAWRKGATEAEVIDRKHLSEANTMVLTNLQNQVTWLSAKLQAVQGQHEVKMEAIRVQHEKCLVDNAELRAELRGLKLRLDVRDVQGGLT